MYSVQYTVQPCTVTPLPDSVTRVAGLLDHYYCDDGSVLVRVGYGIFGWARFWDPFIESSLKDPLQWKGYVKDLF